jgi:hypothetical protein
MQLDISLSINIAPYSRWCLSICLSIRLCQAFPFDAISPSYFVVVVVVVDVVVVVIDVFSVSLFHSMFFSMRRKEVEERSGKAVK